MDISAVIVSWNVRELLDRCLQSVYAAAGQPGVGVSRVVVVDNASGDGSAEVVRLRFLRVHSPQRQLTAPWEAGVP